MERQEMLMQQIEGTIVGSIFSGWEEGCKSRRLTLERSKANSPISHLQNTVIQGGLVHVSVNVGKQ